MKFSSSRSKEEARFLKELALSLINWKSVSQELRLSPPWHHQLSSEGRYLLSGASDGSAAIFDVQRPSDYGGGIVAKHKCLFVVDRQHEQAHKHAISSAIWYPIDTGLFITGSYDHYINVWDTNTTQEVKMYKCVSVILLQEHLLTHYLVIVVGTPTNFKRRGGEPELLSIVGTSSHLPSEPARNGGWKK